MENPVQGLHGSFQFMPGVGLQFCFYHQDLCVKCSAGILKENFGNFWYAIDKALRENE